VSRTVDNPRFLWTNPARHSLDADVDRPAERLVFRCAQLSWYFSPPWHLLGAHGTLRAFTPGRGPYLALVTTLQPLRSRCSCLPIRLQQSTSLKCRRLASGDDRRYPGQDPGTMAPAHFAVAVPSPGDDMGSTSCATWYGRARNKFRFPRESRNKPTLRRAVV
jgi:hypothetical protein